MFLILYSYILHYVYHDIFNNVITVKIKYIFKQNFYQQSVQNRNPFFVMHSFRRLTTADFKCSKLFRLSWLKAKDIAFLREPMEEMG